MSNSADPWRALDATGWASTKQTLHLNSQLLGKIRLALSPPQPNWMFTALYMSPRGLTTGTIPCSDASIECMLDIFDSVIRILRSDGRTRAISFLPPRTVADVYAELTVALQELDVACYISPVPQEIPDTTPLPADQRVRPYDPAAALRWFRTYTAVAGIFDRWRSRFFGRSGVQVWWGAFDVNLMLFNGKHVAPPTNRGYLLKYDLDAELMSAGLYLGDEKTAPFFYGYIYPEPSGAPALPLRPAGASWSMQLHEWVLPYDDVRTSSDPQATLRTFIDAIYTHCFDAAGWDKASLTYELPKVHAQRPAT
jgi:hypothetical protein